MTDNQAKWKAIYDLGEPLMVFTKQWEPVTKCPSKYKHTARFKPTDNSHENLVSIYTKLGNQVNKKPVVPEVFVPSKVLSRNTPYQVDMYGQRIYEYLDRRVLGVAPDSNNFNYGD